MNKQLIIAAAIASRDVYYDKMELGVTSIMDRIKVIDGKKWMVCAFEGTKPVKADKGKDWGRNFKMWADYGIKNHAFEAAERVAQLGLQDYGLPMLISGHSHGASEAISFFKMYCDDKIDVCIPFAPAPIFTYEVPINNCLIVINDRDIVPYAGAVKFDHPKCDTLFFDHKGIAHKNLTMPEIYWKSVWRFWRFRERVTDHNITDYLINVHNMPELEKI